MGPGVTDHPIRDESSSPLGSVPGRYMPGSPQEDHPRAVARSDGSWSVDQNPIAVVVKRPGSSTDRALI
jgi:hypothetical protein